VIDYQEELNRIFGPGGALAQTLPGHEHRPEQVRMAREVMERFVRGGILLVEAGTGTGKSLAYLVPAALWAGATGEVVVVSTHTINLQEQLIHNDLPLLERLLPEPVPVALVKGWGNYLCRRRLDLLSRNSSALPGALQDALDDLQLRARRAVEGSRSELDLAGIRELWPEVEAEPDACPKDRCPWFSRCFVFLARRRMQSARLLVVNHAMLCSDLAIKGELPDQEGGVLPPYCRLVVDEAHHLAEVASCHLGCQAKWSQTRKILSGLYRREGGKDAGGILPILRHALAGAGLPRKLQRALEKAIDSELLTAHPALGESQDEFWHRLEGWMQAVAGKKTTRIRLLADHLESPQWEQLAASGCEAAEGMKHYAAALGRILEQIGEELRKPVGAESVEKSEALSITLDECMGFCSRLNQFAAVLPFLLDAADPERVFWVEQVEGRPFELGIHCAPLDAGGELDRLLHSRLASGVFTSATLAAGEDFSYMR